MVNLAKFIACVPSQGGAGVEEGGGGVEEGGGGGCHLQRPQEPVTVTQHYLVESGRYCSLFRCVLLSSR